MKSMKNLKEKNMYDERQLQIRGDIFQHGYIAAMLLLLANAMLNSFDIVWASAFEQNLLIMLFITTIVSVEANLRGVFFGKNKKSTIILFIMGMCTGFLVAITTRHFADGAVFVSERMLSREGYTIVLCVLLSVNVIVGLVAQHRFKKQETEE
ncbi:MAG: hypothetical protein FWG70_10700 [Oscillospiraceae bacterium]|nr:hypothetical protein [Oscillospiraceae bacterium]